MPGRRQRQYGRRFARLPTIRSIMISCGTVTADVVNSEYPSKRPFDCRPPRGDAKIVRSESKHDAGNRATCHKSIFKWSRTFGLIQFLPILKAEGARRQVFHMPHCDAKRHVVPYIPVAFVPYRPDIVIAFVHTQPGHKRIFWIFCLFLSQKRMALHVIGDRQKIDGGCQFVTSGTGRYMPRPPHEETWDGLTSCRHIEQSPASVTPPV